MAVSEHFHFNNVKGRIITLRNRLGQACVGTGWLVQPVFNFDGKSITLTSVVTGMSHYEKWEQVQRWLEQGLFTVAAEEPAYTDNPRRF